VTSPGGARSSDLAPSVPDHPGPFLRLDHSSDQAARAADTLAAHWEAFERGRRWRFFVLVPALLLAALAGGALDRAMGFHVRLATWYARLLLLRASGAILIEEHVADPSGTKLALVRGSAGPTLVVGAQSLEAKRGTHVEAPPWYAARPIGAAVGAVLLLTLALLATLRPPAPQ